MHNTHQQATLGPGGGGGTEADLSPDLCLMPCVLVCEGDQVGRLSHLLVIQRDNKQDHTVILTTGSHQGRGGGAGELHCKKRIPIFPSPAGMSFTILSLAGNN
jgi:hypothetical protein